MTKQKHLVFFSGGTSSWYIAQVLKEEYGQENLSLVFTDTLIEDNDLYRFIIEGAAKIYEIDEKIFLPLMNRAKELTLVYEDMDIRKKELEQLRLDVREIMPDFHWLSEQRDIWDVFYDVRFLGNSRVAHCTAQLKQRMAKRYVKKTFNSSDTILYLGIDWTEEHRSKAPVKNWSPFEVRFPLIEDLTFSKIKIVKKLEELNIELPALYKMGFVHNNCGGMCVKAGQGHFANLLEKNRKLYLYHENRERDFIEWRGADVAILKRSKTIKTEHKAYEPSSFYDYLNENNMEDSDEALDAYNEYVSKSNGFTEKKTVISPLTLEQLRKELDAKNTCNIDFMDIGGCGCFLTDDEE